MWSVVYNVFELQRVWEESETQKEEEEEEATPQDEVRNHTACLRV